MNVRTLIGFGIVIAGAIAIVVTSGGHDDPEAAIRQMILEARDAAEKQDLGGVLEHISEEFSARDMGRDQIKGYLFMQLRRGTWRKVFVVDMQVEVEDELEPRKGRVNLRLVLASGDAIASLQQALVANAGAWRLMLDVARQDDDAWRVTGGDWKRVPASELVLPEPG